MSGGHTVSVQASRVQSLAGQVRTTATDLGGLAEQIGAALAQVAGAVPGTGLASKAAEASGAWSVGLGDIARAGDSLAAATEASAEAYRCVEGRSVQRFTGTGRP